MKKRSLMMMKVGLFLVEVDESCAPFFKLNYLLFVCFSYSL